MCKFILTVFILCFISCSTTKDSIYSYDAIEISRLTSFGKTIQTEYTKSECGLKTSRITSRMLRDSLTLQNISSISVKYSYDTVSTNEYFYGNNIKLPDSCIIFSRDDYKANSNQVTSTLLFYFFSKTKRTNFHFNTYKAIKETTQKINDSIWVYKSVHKLVVTH